MARNKVLLLEQNNTASVDATAKPLATDTQQAKQNHNNNELPEVDSLKKRGSRPNHVHDLLIGGPPGAA